MTLYPFRFRPFRSQRLFPRWTRETGLLLASSGGGGGSGFTIPSSASASTPDKVPLAPNFIAGPTGLDPYRPLRHVVMDGELFVCNGWDNPRRWDRTNAIWAYMGSVVPATGAAALKGAGTAIPNGLTATYYLVGYNSTLDKESSPQTVTRLNNAGSTQDITVTWTAAEFAADQDKVRLYRKLDGTDDYKFIADIAKATATYDDAATDASLATATSWNGSERASLPPIFIDMAESQGLLWGWVEDSEFLYYSQGVRVSGTFVADDFPSGNILPVGADEGTGSPTAFYPFYGSDLIWKKRAIYEKTGTDIFTWSITRCPGNRGTFNRSTVVPLDGRFLCLDELGIYSWTPGAEPRVVGTNPNQRQSPMRPIFARMNLSVANTFHAVQIERESIVIFYVALDYEPLPNTGIVYDYSRDSFLGITTRRFPTATGLLADSFGVPHPCFGDDLAYLWEDLYGESEGVFSGDNTGTATAGSLNTITASGAAWNTGTTGGAPGAPMDRYSSAGVVVDENRVYSATGTVLTTYLYPTTAYAASDTVAIGVIPGILELARLTFRSHEEKNVRDVILEFASGVSGSIRLDVARNDDDFALKFEQSLATDVRAIIPASNVTDNDADFCWLYGLRISQRYANLGFSLRAIHIHYDLIPGTR